MNYSKLVVHAQNLRLYKIYEKKTFKQLGKQKVLSSSREMLQLSLCLCTKNVFYFKNFKLFMFY